MAKVFPDELEFELCSKKDISILAEIASQSYAEHYTYLWEDEGKKYVQDFFNPSQLSREMEAEGTYFYLIQFNGKSVGIIKLNESKGYVNLVPKASLELERIYLLKEVGGLGIGSLAIQKIGEMGKEKKLHSLWLKVMKKSPVVNFYLKNGFKSIAETILNMPMVKNEFREMLVMEKIL